jgi:salicylate 5-hydroxylase large subunit
MPEANVLASELKWPGGNERVPYWIYTDQSIYQRELERIFKGPTWNYVALECEIPQPGDFKRTFIGDQSVLIVRDRDGAVRGLVNRCAHRGVELCQQNKGSVAEFMCPYHQWVYDLGGKLQGVPFRRGVKGKGGMPKDFDPADHNLRRIRVAVRNGGVFATLSSEAPELEAYFGPMLLACYDRVFDGRKLTLLGHMRQEISANWKLMVENIKDPYHASLLHVFFVTFGLFRVDNKSKVQMDESGLHTALTSQRGEQEVNEGTAQMKSFKSDLVLADPRLLDAVREFPGEATVVMHTIWPNLILQQQSNTLATRQIVPKGPAVFELHWTFFGYETDDAEMTARRLRQANLMGPAGLVSMDDSEIIARTQATLASARGDAGVVEMGGRDTADADHMVTEVALRAFYDGYRRVMAL